MPSSPTITIGISGPTSSGKTTLALALAAIFSTSSPRNANPPIIHQDNYFRPKPDCPRVSYIGSPLDEIFLRKTIEHNALLRDETGEKALYQVIRTCGKFVVTGPDTDCWGAVDLGAVIGRVKHARAGKWEKEDGIAIDRMGTSHDAVSAQFESLIARQQCRVENWMRRTRIDCLPNLTFLEGFLLYSDELPKGKVDENQKLRRELMEAIDIKLFLPVSEKTAKQRRFRRTPYVDPPVGDRQPGQCWKTEGYFDSVAWRNYLDEHRWLLDGGTTQGVEVEDPEASAEERVDWAVGIILKKLSSIVKDG